MRYTLRAYENQNSDFWNPFKSGDQLTPVGLYWTATADTPECAADQLWQIGNKMGADDDGREWPMNRRSMSLGDVVVVVTPDGDVAYAVAHAGWDRLAPGVAPI